VGDGPDLALAQQMARDLGIGGLVDAVGAQEEVVPLLSIADLFLLPSAQESFGLAALEAMACEVPVIASRVGGLPEVIEHGVSGFLHPLDAEDEMAASAVLLLTNPALHYAVAQAACRRVRSEFCVERVVPMYEACYRELLS
jgi:glycosyltransferase involved in cell wall biosynthesis